MKFLLHSLNLTPSPSLGFQLKDKLNRTSCILDLIKAHTALVCVVDGLVMNHCTHGLSHCRPSVVRVWSPPLEPLPNVSKLYTANAVPKITFRCSCVLLCVRLVVPLLLPSCGLCDLHTNTLAHPLWLCLASNAWCGLQG